MLNRIREYGLHLNKAKCVFSDRNRIFGAPHFQGRGEANTEQSKSNAGGPSRSNLEKDFPSASVLSISLGGYTCGEIT